MRGYRVGAIVGVVYAAIAMCSALGPESASGDTPPPGERLYNGIVLPAQWPPRNMDPWSEDPMPVPYLERRPDVIPIDVGRQLFVDDFLIEATDLQRTFHRAKKFDGSPLLKPETPLEMGRYGAMVPPFHAPLAAPFSDGIWYDPADRTFKLWYHAGWFDGTAYATSQDGLKWHRPDLDVEPGTNRVLPRRTGGVRDTVAVCLDQFTDDPSQRFKMFMFISKGEVRTSPDGIHWSDPTLTGRVGDHSTIFHNPFRRKWVYSIRSDNPATRAGRSRDYRECDDLIEGAKFADGDVVFWTRADRLDPQDPQIRDKPQLYNLDAVAYESIMLSAFTIHLGPANAVCNWGGFPKVTDLKLGFSRDGFHWQRPDRRAFIAATRREGDWDRGYLQSAASVCLIVGDELWFYYTGFAGDVTKRNCNPDHYAGMYANGSMGLAKLRRDGFASMDAGDARGTLTTRPLTFKGKRLFVNVDNPEGALTVEVLDQAGAPLDGWTADRCEPVSTDSTLTEVRWRGGKDVSSLAGMPVRFRFHLTRGSLYAFWVAPDERGASHGYVAGGGPGFTGPTDTVGRGTAR